MALYLFLGCLIIIIGNHFNNFLTVLFKIDMMMYEWGCKAHSEPLYGYLDNITINISSIGIEADTVWIMLERVYLLLTCDILFDSTILAKKVSLAVWQLATLDKTLNHYILAILNNFPLLERNSMLRHKILKKLLRAFQPCIFFQKFQIF